MMRALGAALVFGLAVAASVPLGACSPDAGPVQSETRPVAGVDSVKLETSGALTIVQTGEESLTVRAGANVLPKLTSTVSGGTLTLGLEGGPPPAAGPIEYALTVDSLDEVSVDGSGPVTVEALSGESFEASIDGSGSITAGGNVESQKVDVSGSGDYHGGALASSTAEVSVSGSGGAEVQASDALAVIITGSGDVRYAGNPTVTQQVSGSGTVAPAS